MAKIRSSLHHEKHRIIRSSIIRTAQSTIKQSSRYKDIVDIQQKDFNAIGQHK